MRHLRKPVYLAALALVLAGLVGPASANAQQSALAAGVARLQPPRGFQAERSNLAELYLIELAGAAPGRPQAARQSTQNLQQGGVASHINTIQVVVFSYNSPAAARAGYARLVPANVAALAWNKSVRDTNSENLRNAQQKVINTTTYSAAQPAIPPGGTVTVDFVQAGYNIAVTPTPGGTTCNVVKRWVVQTVAKAVIARAVPGRGWATITKQGLGKKIYAGETREIYEVVGSDLLITRLFHMAVPQTVGTPTRQNLVPRPLVFPAALLAQTRQSALNSARAAPVRGPGFGPGGGGGGGIPGGGGGAAAAGAIQLTCAQQWYTPSKLLVRIPPGRGGIAITGTVRDNFGNVVAGAAIQTTVNGNTVAVRSNQQGVYTLTLSRAGRPATRGVTQNFTLVSPLRQVTVSFVAKGPKGQTARTNRTYNLAANVGTISIPGTVSSRSGRSVAGSTVSAQVQGSQSIQGVWVAKNGAYRIPVKLDATRPQTVGLTQPVNLALP